MDLLGLHYNDTTSQTAQLPRESQETSATLNEEFCSDSDHGKSCIPHDNNAAFKNAMVALENFYNDQIGNGNNTINRKSPSDQGNGNSNGNASNNTTTNIKETITQLLQEVMAHFDAANNDNTLLLEYKDRALMCWAKAFITGDHKRALNCRIWYQRLTGLDDRYVDDNDANSNADLYNIDVIIIDSSDDEKLSNNDNSDLETKHDERLCEILDAIDELQNILLILPDKVLSKEGQRKIQTLVDKLGVSSNDTVVQDLPANFHFRMSCLLSWARSVLTNDFDVQKRSEKEWLENFNTINNDIVDIEENVHSVDESDSATDDHDDDNDNDAVTRFISVMADLEHLLTLTVPSEKLPSTKLHKIRELLETAESYNNGNSKVLVNDLPEEFHFRRGCLLSWAHALLSHDYIDELRCRNEWRDNLDNTFVVMPRQSPSQDLSPTGSSPLIDAVSKKEAEVALKRELLNAKKKLLSALQAKKKAKQEDKKQQNQEFGSKQRPIELGTNSFNSDDGSSNRSVSMDVSVNEFESPNRLQKQTSIEDSITEVSCFIIDRAGLGTNEDDTLASKNVAQQIKNCLQRMKDVKARMDAISAKMQSISKNLKREDENNYIPVIDTDSDNSQQITQQLVSELAELSKELNVLKSRLQELQNKKQPKLLTETNNETGCNSNLSSKQRTTLEATTAALMDETPASPMEIEPTQNLPAAIGSTLKHSNVPPNRKRNSKRQNLAKLKKSHKQNCLALSRKKLLSQQQLLLYTVQEKNLATKQEMDLLDDQIADKEELLKEISNQLTKLKRKRMELSDEFSSSVSQVARIEQQIRNLEKGKISTHSIADM